jgi:hypothetical protein
VKLQEEQQPKPQDEQEKKPQDQAQVNHSDLKMKKTRWGPSKRTLYTRRLRSYKHKIEMIKKLAISKCFSCDEVGHYALGCPNKLEDKDQANNEKQ